MCFLILGQSVRLKKTKRNHKKSQNRRPGIPASLLWSLETKRHEHKIYMAEAFVAVIVKSRQHEERINHHVFSRTTFRNSI